LSSREELKLTAAFARTRTAVVAVPAIVLACLAFTAAVQAKPAAHPGKHRSNGTEVRVMTRNLYLGADLGPAMESTSTAGFIEANGGIIRAVEASNFPVRAKGLAQEILEKEPDLIGLQEAALWREAAPSLGPVFSGRPEATKVKYDFIKLLLAQLNKGKARYRLVVAQDEFDFEAPADANGVPGDGPSVPGLLENAEVNGRLTMRDAILARVGADVKTSNPKMGHFEHLQVSKVAGSKEIAITRGWVSVEATVRGSRRFRFVDTHLESFDNEAVYPSIRAQQASELVAPGGPVSGKLPVILVGDLNSDVKTEVKPGDGQAYRVLTQAGLRERSTYQPLGCCIEGTEDLRGGSVADFNHKVDHIMTDAPKQVKLLESAVTGRSKHDGYWDSDHAGLFSALSIRR
jgi:endonuclease/exonuclease/phosphatase family metal-dependent hydrolase